MTDPMHFEAAFPPPGSFGLSRIRGPVGWFVWLGQALSGDRSKWTHAFFVLDNSEVIEAEPGGAKIRPLERYYRHAEVLFCDAPVRGWARDLRASEGFLADVVLSARVDVLRAALVAHARSFEGAPYNWLNYPALGLLALGIQPAWLVRFVSRAASGMICSQLVDFLYESRGIHLFDDGRVPAQVTPGDLWKYVQQTAQRAGKRRHAA